MPLLKLPLGASLQHTLLLILEKNNLVALLLSSVHGVVGPGDLDEPEVHGM